MKRRIIPAGVALLLAATAAAGTTPAILEEAVPVAKGQLAVAAPPAFTYLSYIRHAQADAFGTVHVEMALPEVPLEAKYCFLDNLEVELNYGFSLRRGSHTIPAENLPANMPEIPTSSDVSFGFHGLGLGAKYLVSSFFNKEPDKGPIPHVAAAFGVTIPIGNSNDQYDRGWDIALELLAEKNFGFAGLDKLDAYLNVGYEMTGELVQDLNPPNLFTIGAGAGFRLMPALTTLLEFQYQSIGVTKFADVAYEENGNEITGSRMEFTPGAVYTLGESMDAKAAFTLSTGDVNWRIYDYRLLFEVVYRLSL